MSHLLKLREWISRSHWRLYWFFSLLAVLPILLYFFSASRVLYSNAEKQALQESAQFAQLSSILIEQEFEQSVSFLQSYALRYRFREQWQRRELDQVVLHLQQAHSLRPDFAFFSVYDLDGTLRVIYPPDPGVLNRNFSFRDWYQGVTRNWEPYVSEVYQSAARPQHLAVAVAVPIQDEQGQPIGILMASYALDTISAWLRKVQQQGTRTLSVVDQNGHLLAHPAIDVFQPPVDISAYEPARRALAGEMGTGVFRSAQEDLFVAFAPIPAFHWGVLVEQPLTAAQEGIVVAQRQMLLLGLFFVVLALASGGLLGKLYRQLFDVKEELRRGEAKFRGLLEASSDAIVGVNAEGLITLVNARTEKLFGYQRDELFGRPVEILVPEKFHRVHKAHRTSYISLPRARSMGTGLELRARRKDGSEFPIEVSLTPLETEEGFLVMGIILDITQQKRYRQEIEQKNQELELRNREVERATQLKSQFLASMSHELRTPLNAIIGFSDLLAEQTAGPLTPKQARYVKHVQTGGHHLLQLINDILDLSKIEAGQMEWHPENFAVEEALSEVLSIIKPLVTGKKIEVSHSLPCELGVYSDRVRFKQILYNLLSNAIKFTPEGGQVGIECSEADGQACLSVWDTGVGIPPEDKEKIFEEFYQAGATTKGVKEGTGLGLAITRRLVEQQGGRIWVESEPGQGSRFSFTLPSGTPRVQGIPQEPQPRLHRSPRTKPLILIVDDEPEARELLVNYLEPEGYEIVTAASRAEALVLAQELQPDAITLNMLMPGKTGWETLHELKNSPATAALPVIIVSVVDRKKMGFALGAAEYLVKPVRREQLLGSIAKQLGPRKNGPTTILVVDDEPRDLQMMTEVLESAGYAPLTASGGQQAMEILSKSQPDAILLDLLMPEMDGFEVIRRIKELPHLQQLPIFVLTAKDLTEVDTDWLARETRAFFQKSTPWKEQFLVQVRQAIAKEEKQPR